MRNYDDTQYSEYLVKKGLSDGEYGQDQLQFQIAFSAFDLQGLEDEETYSERVYSNADHDKNL